MINWCAGMEAHSEPHSFFLRHYSVGLEVFWLNPMSKVVSENLISLQLGLVSSSDWLPSHKIYQDLSSDILYGTIDQENIYHLQ